MMDATDIREPFNRPWLLYPRLMYQSVADVGDNHGPSSTGEPGNIYFGPVTLDLPEDDLLLIMLTGYVYNNYSGWATLHSCFQHSPDGITYTTIRRGKGSATLGLDNAGGNENVTSAFMSSRLYAATAGTHYLRCGLWKSGGGSYAPRLYDYEFLIFGMRS